MIDEKQIVPRNPTVDTLPPEDYRLLTGADELISNEVCGFTTRKSGEPTGLYKIF
jgi:hypothetical protein